MDQVEIEEGEAEILERLFTCSLDVPPVGVPSGEGFRLRLYDLLGRVVRRA